MEKISGIIAPSPRMQKIAASQAQSAGSSKVSVGQPEQKSSLGDRVSLSKNVSEKVIDGDSGTMPFKNAASLFAEKSDDTPVGAKDDNLSKTAESVKSDFPTYRNTKENSKIKIIENLNRKYFLGTPEMTFEKSSVGFSEASPSGADNTVSIMDAAPPVLTENRDLPMNTVDRLL